MVESLLAGVPCGVVVDLDFAEVCRTVPIGRGMIVIRRASGAR